MSIEEGNKDGFIQERLDSLYEIDCKIVSLLDNMSSLFQTYSTPKLNDSDLGEQKEQLKNQTKTIYSTISNIAIGLRKEVKKMDENIGVYNKNEDGIMILPISVDQKNTTLGSKKLNDEIEEMNSIVGGESGDVEIKNEDQATTTKQELNNESAIKEETSKDDNDELMKENDSDFDMLV